jgi:Icc-related predicted phosphoesterase
MQLLVLSDIHGAAHKVKRILANRHTADLAIIAGDLTHLGGAKQAEEIITPLLESGLRLLAVPGNMDTREVLDYLQEKKISIHGRGTVIDKVGFFGLGGGNYSPFRAPFEQSEQEIEELLNKGFMAVQGSKPIVLISHVPPFATLLDRTFAGVHCGSQAVKDFLLAKAPELCICGHIHESANQELVGKTISVNVGAVKNDNYCLIELLHDKINISRRTIL